MCALTADRHLVADKFRLFYLVVDYIKLGLMFLAIVDMLAGIAVMFPNFFTSLSLLIFFLAIVHVLKGTWSILTSLADSFRYDVLGAIDLVTGGIMFALYANVTYSFFWVIGAVVMFKGIWSLLFSLR